MKKAFLPFIVGVAVGAVLVAVLSALPQIRNPNSCQLESKPVIYLYPEKELDCVVHISYPGLLTHVYPDFSMPDTWGVTAHPDGSLRVGDATLRYLYWEGEREAKYSITEGACVSGSETQAYLIDSLTAMGYNSSEIADFITYWVPQMKDNPYNLIQFIESPEELEISPTPDTVLQTFMLWRPSKHKVKLEPQTFDTSLRRGFTVVEWGGAKIAP